MDLPNSFTIKINHSCDHVGKIPLNPALGENSPDIKEVAKQIFR